MTENNKLNENALPEAKVEKSAESTATIPNAEREIFVPVKFNKEIKNLTIEEASELAQKGLKFDAVSEDYKTLKGMAMASKQSVPQFLESLKNSQYQEKLTSLTQKCGGDRQLAEHIINLEDKTDMGDISGFEELREYFPEVSRLEDLPAEVLDNARLRGRALLDEYLRYRLIEKRRVAESQRLEKNALAVSTGSQIDRTGVINPETAEFLKGLWR